MNIAAAVIHGEKAAILAGTLLAVGLTAVGRYQGEAGRNLAELVAIILSCGIFILVWYLRRIMDRPYLVFIGMAFLFVAFFDSMRLLIVPAMNAAPGSWSGVSELFRLTGRFWEGVFFCIAPWITAQHLRRIHIPILGFGLITALFFSLVAIWPSFAVFHAAEGINSVAMISVFLLVPALYRLIRQKDHFQENEFRLITASIILSIISQLLSARFIIPLPDSWPVGSFIRVVSLYLLLRAIVINSIGKYLHVSSPHPCNLIPEDLFWQTVDRYPDLFIIYDNQRRIQYINAKAATLNGFRTEEMIGKTDAMLHPPEVTDTYLPFMDYVFQEKKSCSQEARVMLPTGRYTFIIRFVPIFNPDGEIRYVLGIHQNITLRKDVEMERERLLQEQMTGKRKVEKLLAQHQAILDNITEGLAIFSPQGRLIEMNPTALELHEIQTLEGYPEDLESFSAFFDYYTMRGERLPISEWPLVKVLQGEILNQYEVEVFHRNTGKRWIGSYSGSLVYSPEQEPLFSVVTIRDVTRKKKIEEDLRQSKDELERRVQERTAELVEANENLKEFAYVASHDLQEPLRKIAYFGERLQYLMQSNLDHKAKDFLARLLNAIMRMRRLVDSLLVYSRISSNELNVGRVDLNEILHDILEDMETYIQEVNGRITFDKLPTIEADDVQMRQLFQNFISNGLKFNVQHDKLVNIRAERPNRSANSTTTTDSSEYRFIIEDNGVGIPSGFTEEIFLPFQRYYSERDYPGAGIGLAICKKIIDRHGGTISASNGPSGGAVFMVTLPEKMVKNRFDKSGEIPSQSKPDPL